MEKNLSRRQFARQIAALGLSAASAPALRTDVSEWTEDTDMMKNPVLESLSDVIRHSQFVKTHRKKIAEHASYMAYEELPIWLWRVPYLPDEDSVRTVDFLLLINSINFAFTDFQTHSVFSTEYAGAIWSDAEAMAACVKRALEDGIPILDGKYLAEANRKDLEKIFQGNIEMPMLDERVKIFNEVGQVLRKKYQGHFHNFIEDCSPKLYDQGRGIIDRLTSELPSFNDVSPFKGQTVKFYKRAQLAAYMLFGRLRTTGLFKLEDPDQFTAFADYIIPVALRLMGMTSYTRELEEKIKARQVIPRHSPEEVEIRAHCLYAISLLTKEINKRRKPGNQIIAPQVDSRLWTHFHKTDWPYHLTITTAY